MNKVILISILLFLFVLLLHNFKEEFTIKQMKNNNDIQALFCKKLNYLNEPSEELKLFLDEINDIERQYTKKINFLESEIANVQNSIKKKDISILKDTLDDNIEKRNKQLEIINLANKNLNSLNTPDINFNIL